MQELQQQQFDVNGSPLKRKILDVVPDTPKANRVSVPIFTGFLTPPKYFSLEKDETITWAPLKEGEFVIEQSPLNMDENTPPKDNLNTDNYRKRKASDDEVIAIQNGNFGF